MARMGGKPPCKLCPSDWVGTCPHGSKKIQMAKRTDYADVKRMATALARRWKLSKKREANLLGLVRAAMLAGVCRAGREVAEQYRKRGQDLDAASSSNEAAVRIVLEGLEKS